MRRRKNPQDLEKMKHLLLCLVSCALVSCSVIPQEVLLPESVLLAEAAQPERKMRLPVIKFGGQFAATRQTKDGEMMAVQTQDEKSFRDGMLAAGVVAGTWANAVATKASEKTAQVVAAEQTKQKATASAAATKQALAAEETKRLGMELEAAAPAVIPKP